VPTYAQLLACDPHAFTEAGQTYQRMAQGFGKVQQTFSQGMKVLSGEVWTGAARDAVLKKATHLDGGLQASGQETNSTGQALIALGQALQAAQASLRSAIATAHGVGLIVTPDGNVFNPNPVYNHAGNAMLGPVRAMIAAAVAAGTAADTAAAGKIATLAVGKLIATFGSQAGRGGAAVQQIAAVATGQTTVDSPGSAAVVAARAAGLPDFGTLGTVARDAIDKVVKPTGTIGGDSIQAWTERHRGQQQT
jgi:hypothetical protein